MELKLNHNLTNEDVFNIHLNNRYLFDFPPKCQDDTTLAHIILVLKALPLATGGRSVNLFIITQYREILPAAIHILHSDHEVLQQLGDLQYQSCLCRFEP